MTVAHVVRVCVTGPECSGKTTLARQLAEHLSTEFVPEAARLYAERVVRPLTVDDVLPIAREHVAMVDAAVQRVRAAALNVVVLDTDLVSTVVYGRHYYGFEDYWLNGEAVRRLADVYLLCDVDLPWVPDGIRDRPLAGNELFLEFADELRRLHARVHVVSGSGDARRLSAIRAIDSL